MKHKESNKKIGLNQLNRDFLEPNSLESSSKIMKNKIKGSIKDNFEFS